MLDRSYPITRMIMLFRNKSVMLGKEVYFLTEIEQARNHCKYKEICTCQ